MTIRGKLGRTVPVLLHNFLVDYVDTLLIHRKKAGVKSTNKFVFAVPYVTRQRKEYLPACPLMRQFANDCGASMPETLRGTILRKHVATYTAMLRLEDSQVDFLCNYMGHSKYIHKNIYRVPNGVIDITEVSRILQAAIGDDEEEEESENEVADAVVKPEVSEEVSGLDAPSEVSAQVSGLDALAGEAPVEGIGFDNEAGEGPSGEIEFDAQAGMISSDDEESDNNRPTNF